MRRRHLLLAALTASACRRRDVPQQAAPASPAEPICDAPIDVVPVVFDGIEYDPDTGVPVGDRYVSEGWPPAHRPWFDDASGIRFDSDGPPYGVSRWTGPHYDRLLWHTPFDVYVGSSRPPDSLLAGDRVVVAAGRGVAALDAQTGAKLWHSKGPSDHLTLDGDYVLATNAGIIEGRREPHWLVARRLSDGVEAWRAETRWNLDADHVTPLGNAIFVGDDKQTVVVGRAGARRFTLDEGLIAARPLVDGDWLLATTRRITRLDPEGRARWSRMKPRDTFVGKGDFVALPDGDLVFYGYCAIADSGVELVRFDARDGREAYRVSARPLGVSHSKYSHDAHVRVRGELIDVVSVGERTFVEVFYAESGARRVRWEAPAPGWPVGRRLAPRTRADAGRNLLFGLFEGDGGEVARGDGSQARRPLGQARDHERSRRRPATAREVPVRRGGAAPPSERRRQPRQPEHPREGVREREERDERMTAYRGGEGRAHDRPRMGPNGLACQRLRPAPPRLAAAAGRVAHAHRAP